MRPSVCAVLLLLGCNRAPAASPSAPQAPAPQPAAGVVDAGVPEPDDRYAWTTWSADGATTLRQRSLGGRCYAECLVGDTRAWELTGPCLAEKTERRFLSKDCDRLVVLIPAPPRGRPWANTEVMRVATKGALDYSVSAVVMVDEKAMKTHTSWLKGCFGEPGREPHYTADGLGVEFESIEGKVTTLPFAKPPPEPAATKPPAKKRPKR